jgi:hypothetical protein
VLDQWARKSHVSPRNFFGLIWIDAIAIDCKGNIYTGEVDTGKRAQKFILKNGDGIVRLDPHD